MGSLRKNILATLKYFKVDFNAMATKTNDGDKFVSRFLVSNKKNVTKTLISPPRTGQ
jgi:hypothetical protein